MKRFMLVSLMSCMLVGQTLCDWRANSKELFKGALVSVASSGSGFLAGCLFSKEASVGLAGLMAIGNGFFACRKIVNMNNNPTEEAYFGTGQAVGAGISLAFLVSLFKQKTIYTL